MMRVDNLQDLGGVKGTLFINERKGIFGLQTNTQPGPYEP